jgi:hypothetical protein
MWYTHVNVNVIRANAKHGRADPPVRFQRGKYGKPTYAMEVAFDGPSRVVYSPDGKLLPCGARLVIESEQEPRIVR